jgi:cytochrome P450
VTNLSYGHENASAQELLREASRELNDYLRAEVERHRREEPDDLLTAMIRVSAGGDMDGEEVRAATGRDPLRWTEPAEFVVRREAKTNFGFGDGPHLCLCAPLARLESRVAIEHLLRLAPNFRLRDIDYGASVFVRGPERGILDVTVRA